MPTNPHASRFKLGMLLDELALPFEQALPIAREMGAEYIWWGDRPVGKPITQLTHADIDGIGNALARNGIKILHLRASLAFANLELSQLSEGPLMENAAFRQDFESVTKAVEVAKRLGAGAISTFGFAWPGEAAGKATWPMRWATRGGIISESDLDRLYEAFYRVTDLAEKNNLDVVIFQMSWNYTNTMGNFIRVAERVGSKRLKIMYNPADSINCGEADVLERGFQSVIPYIHSVHLKGVRVVDGPRGKYEYCSLAEGDVDFETVLRQARAHTPNAVISLATHYTPADGSPITAMRTNMEYVKGLVRKIGTVKKDVIS